MNVDPHVGFAHNKYYVVIHILKYSKVSALHGAATLSIIINEM